jgi:hypothetical protein
LRPTKKNKPIESATEITFLFFSLGYLTPAATQYSLWGQKLERELNRIDPNGAPGRRFDAQGES